MKPQYRITCFLKEEPAVLFPMLLPFHFKWGERNSIVWERENVRFQLIPFSSKGTESMGYRIMFNGNPDTFVYLADQFLGSFAPTYSGIEWIYQSEKTQDEAVKIAEKHKFQRCSMYGLYEHNKVGIVLMKTGDINLQIRNLALNSRNLSSYMYEIEHVASSFLPKVPDLFSILDEEIMAS